jgi:AAA+ superfamily predicted ATPase
MPLRLRHTRRRRPTAQVPGHARSRLAGYLANTLEGAPLTARSRAALFHWAAKNAVALGLDLPDDFIQLWIDDDLEEREPNRLAIRTLRAALDEMPAIRRADRPFGRLAKLLGLDELEEQILTLAADYRAFSAVEQLWDHFASEQGMEINLSLNPSLFAKLLGVSEGRIAKRLQPDAPLRASGLLLVEHPRSLDVLPRLIPFVSEPAPPRDPQRALLGAVAEAELPFGAFAHLGEEATHALAMLRGALEQRETGIHILLYGAPGTGKTAFAAALAQELGVALYEVGLENPDGEEPDRAQRLAELRLGQRLLGGSGPALLLLDEAEDMFEAQEPFFLRGPRRGSRAFVHRMLETSPVPVIWTANDISGFGPAALRRMSCAIEVRVPPAPVRQRLWSEAADAEGVPLPEEEAHALAELLPAAPALARSAMRAARLAGGNVATVRWAVSGVARAMAGGRLPPPNGLGEPFDPLLVNADTDLAALAERLAAPGRPQRVSLLLSGPPGSGKSAFARHLASRMGLPVLLRRASDVLDAYVGGTEQKIAAAFAEARDAGAFLIFDEADSLLGDRKLAHRSWEVSQVNEMLTWMESHPLPFCCTTNLVERLDEATARRFLIKARFQFLTAPQVARAWETILRQPLPAAGLGHLDRLTPADFGLVRRLAEMEGRETDAAWLLAALEREQRAKPGATGPIGFRVG